MKETLNASEKIRYKTRYCKGCGKRLQILSGHRTYCEKCRPVYPSDKFHG